jgi:hypothetical protein
MKNSVPYSVKASYYFVLYGVTAATLNTFSKWHSTSEESLFDVIVFAALTAVLLAAFVPDEDFIPKQQLRLRRLGGIFLVVCIVFGPFFMVYERWKHRSQWTLSEELLVHGYLVAVLIVECIVFLYTTTKLRERYLVRANV